MKSLEIYCVNLTIHIKYGCNEYTLSDIIDELELFVFIAMYVS